MLHIQSRMRTSVALQTNCSKKQWRQLILTFAHRFFNCRLEYLDDVALSDKAVAYIREGTMRSFVKPLKQSILPFSETSGTDELNLKVSGMPTGMAVTWLGTSSGAPTLQRNVSSICVRWPYTTYVFDAGEGTQVQLLKSDMYPAHIRRYHMLLYHMEAAFFLFLQSW